MLELSGMTRPLRDKNPQNYRLITIRTNEALLWITPSSNVRKLIGGIIARYQELLGIEIYAYAVLGNHIHLLIRAPRANVDEFQENVNREIARRLNRKHRRTGRFWHKRYKDQKILSEADLLRAFLYVTTNPTKHGLVKKSADWPGLISYQHALSEKAELFSFRHYSKSGGISETTTHALRLSILPQFRDLSPEERREKLKKLLRDETNRLIEERLARGEGFLGLAGLRAQIPGSRPQTVSTSPCPSCYTSCPELRREHQLEQRELRGAYSEASFRYRLGDRNVRFPSYTFLPPGHRIPRLVPFCPLISEIISSP